MSKISKTNQGKCFSSAKTFALLGFVTLSSGNCFGNGYREPNENKRDLTEQEKTDFKTKAPAIIKESTDEIFKKFDDKTRAILRKRGKDDSYIAKHRNFLNQILERYSYIISNKLLGEIAEEPIWLKVVNGKPVQETSSEIVQGRILKLKDRMAYLFKGDRNPLTNLDIVLSGEFDYDIH